MDEAARLDFHNTQPAVAKYFPVSGHAEQSDTLQSSGETTMLLDVT